MLAQAIQAVASPFLRLAAAVSTACTGVSTSHVFILIAIFIAVIFGFPNSSSPTNVPRTESTDLGHGNPNSPVPRFNSSAIWDLAEIDEEEEGLRKELDLILEGDLDKFLLCDNYLRWRQVFSMANTRPPPSTASRTPSASIGQSED